MPPAAISVAVGGPLDIDRGIILSPPHLPTWDKAPLKERLEANYGLPVLVEHDGNAGALAEYYFGAGQGVKNLIYLTLGTGLGAGIILNGQVYHGVNDMAGEVGHIRMAEHGPMEYGKIGSWESFCSGSGLVRLARLRQPAIWPEGVSTQQIVQKALDGDSQALEIIEEMGCWLGKGLAVLVDILNPEIICLGTLGVVLGNLLMEPARRVVHQEAMPASAAACQIVPAQLGAKLGMVSSLMAVIDAFRNGRFNLHANAVDYTIDHNIFSQVVSSLDAGLEVRQRTIEHLAGQIAETALLMVQVLQKGGKVLVFGNGGSAATAQHMAGELVGRYRANRKPLPAVALTADSNVLTCIGNDYDYGEVFARQVNALAQPGDLVIGITTSGRSENVLRGLKSAQEIGAATIALTGRAGLTEPVAQHVLAIESLETARVQEEHDAILHAWCEVLDSAFD